MWVRRFGEPSIFTSGLPAGRDDFQTKEIERWQDVNEETLMTSTP